MEKKRILWIDDEARYIKPCADALRVGGFKVKVVGSAKKGFREFLTHQQNYDLVILDLIMPLEKYELPSDAGPNDIRRDYIGIRVLEEIREFSDVPVIICTLAGEDNNVRDRVHQLGISEFLHKPTLTEEPLKSVQRVLGKKYPR